MSKSKSNRGKSHDDKILVGNWIQITRALLISASIITAYLALLTLKQGGDVPGCGPESDCNKVLNSQWAYLLGIPVSIPGLVLYLVFFLKTFGLKDHLLSPKIKNHIRSLNTLTLCAFGVIGAGIWFIAIQTLVIKAFCPYCCTAHVLAMTAAGIFLARSGVIAKRLNVKINIIGGILTMITLMIIIGSTQYLFPKQKPAAKIIELGNSETNTVNNETKPNFLKKERDEIIKNKDKDEIIENKVSLKTDKTEKKDEKFEKISEKQKD